MNDESQETQPQAPAEDQASEEAAPSQPDQADIETRETSEPESFHDLDLSRIPEDTDPREWALKREKDMQSAWTRKTQELATEREAAQEAQNFYRLLRDPETQAEALRRLGFDLEDDEEPIELSEEDELRQTVQQLQAERQQELQQREQAQAEQAELAEYGDWLDDLEKREGREISDEEAELIYGAGKLNPDRQGRPNYDRGYELLTGISKNGSTKPKAPRVPAPGRAASRGIDLSDRESKLAAATDAAEAVMSQS